MRIPTFEITAPQYYESLRAGWKNKRHESWLSTLSNHIFPMIGKTPVDAVDSALVCEALGPIWLEIPDAFNRFIQRIGAVLDFAYIKGWRKEETSLRWPHPDGKGLSLQFSVIPISGQIVLRQPMPRPEAS